MEFHVQIAGSPPDLGAVSEAIQGIDPSAMVDIDADGQVLRIAAALNLAEVLALLGRTGYPVAPEQVRQLPSICCGGCSG